MLSKSNDLCFKQPYEVETITSFTLKIHLM